MDDGWIDSSTWPASAPGSCLFVRSVSTVDPDFVLIAITRLVGLFCAWLSAVVQARTAPYQALEVPEQRRHVHHRLTGPSRPRLMFKAASSRFAYVDGNKRMFTDPDGNQMQAVPIMVPIVLVRCAMSPGCRDLAVFVFFGIHVPCRHVMPHIQSF